MFMIVGSRNSKISVETSGIQRMSDIKQSLKRARGKMSQLVNDTMEAEDADPGYNEPVVFNQTANQSYSQGVHGANDYKFSSDKDGISNM